ncbi:MAG: hypothetical protein ACI9J2_002038 [Saprospiraceae bacterium]|jgi:hypothetical protein
MGKIDEARQLLRTLSIPSDDSKALSQQLEIVDSLVKVILRTNPPEENPFDHFDVIFCINLDCQTHKWDFVLAQPKRLNIANRLGRFSAVETPENHHIGCALSHREIIQIAQDRAYKNVLVLEDDVLFSVDTPEVL